MIKHGSSQFRMNKNDNSHIIFCVSAMYLHSLIVIHYNIASKNLAPFQRRFKSSSILCNWYLINIYYVLHIIEGPAEHVHKE